MNFFVKLFLVLLFSSTVSNASETQKLLDELAAASSLLMGQAAQKKPVILIKGYQFKQNNLSDSQSLIRGEEEDLFR